MDNYPDDIRDSKNHPMSPLYDDGWRDLAIDTLYSETLDIMGKLMSNPVCYDANNFLEWLENRSNGICLNDLIVEFAEEMVK